MIVRPEKNKDVIEDLARQTAAPVEVVKDLYEDEVTRLKADATVENYIGVIASQRVKRKLRARRRAVAPAG
jgi:predicted transcriptional regulator